MTQTLSNAPAASASGDAPAPPCTLVIFGAGGDLTKRLLMPSLYNLAGSGLLNDKLQILGLDHTAHSDDEWRDGLTETMESFQKDKAGEFHASVDQTKWGFIVERLHYLTDDFEDAKSYADLKARLDNFAKDVGSGNVVFYFAVAARFFGPIVDNLGEAGLLQESPETFRRVVIEKPFGNDLASARDLNARILQHMDEKQVYRIDTSTAFRSPPRKRSESSNAAAFTKARALCAIWYRTIYFSC